MRWALTTPELCATKLTRDFPATLVLDIPVTALSPLQIGLKPSANQP
jgi:hypothetical protein